MPRQARLDAPGSLHHVMGRGSEKARIFQADIVGENFRDRLADYGQEGGGKSLVRARRIFCELAARRMGYPGAEVARYSGVTTSAINRLATSEAFRELLQYI